MAAIRVYLDEDVNPFIADALRLRGWDAIDGLTTVVLVNTERRPEMQAVIDTVTGPR
jgi:hypothetical protein